MGTAGLPNILDPEGKVDRVALAYWTKGDFRDHSPSPKPDGGVKDTRVPLTELLTIPAIQAVLPEYNLGQETIDRLHRDAMMGLRSPTHSMIRTSSTPLPTLAASLHASIGHSHASPSWQ